MTRKFPFRIIVAVLSLLVVSSVINAIAASNTISGSNNLDEQSTPLPTVNDKKPVECSALNLTDILECTGGICNGTDASELIIGSIYSDEINGGKGADCVLGGDDDDKIDGEQGKDVCVGGLGTDSFKKCETEIQ